MKRLVLQLELAHKLQPPDIIALSGEKGANSVVLVHSLSTDTTL